MLFSQIYANFMGTQRDYLLLYTLGSCAQISSFDILWYSVSLPFTLLKAAFLVDCSIEALLLAPSYPPTTFQPAVVELRSQFVQFCWTWAPQKRKKTHIPIGSDWPIGCTARKKWCSRYRKLGWGYRHAFNILKRSLLVTLTIPYG